MACRSQLRGFLVITVCTLGVSLIPPAAASDTERGQILYENHCRMCHESWVHTRSGRKVTSMKDLRRRVRAWSIHSGLDWRNEEIDDVTDYLNRKFYRIQDSPSGQR